MGRKKQPEPTICAKLKFISCLFFQLVFRSDIYFIQMNCFGRRIPFSWRVMLMEKRVITLKSEMQYQKSQLTIVTFDSISRKTNGIPT
jgi:hypothetical protein